MLKILPALFFCHLTKCLKINFRVDAAIKVLESLSAQGRPIEIDTPEFLKQISLFKIKTIKGSIDERDSLRRSLEQAHEIFYVSENDKFGLVKFKPKFDPSKEKPVKPKDKRGRPKLSESNRNTEKVKNEPQYDPGTQNVPTKGSKGKKKKDSNEQRQRKFSEDLFAPESPLIGINLKDYINEDTFNQLPIAHKVIHLKNDSKKLTKKQKKIDC
jgi:hypothetical protein